MESKRIVEKQIEYEFKIHAFRLETDGRYDENGKEVEHVKNLASFEWSNLDYGGAYNKAVKIGKTADFFPEAQHYYGHWAE